VTLTIFVAPATSRAAAADPVVLLAGGPGQGAAEVGPLLAQRFDALRRERDMVFIDMRGTGSSGPLRCDISDPEDLGQLLGGTLELDGLDGCLAGYEGDLSQYSTATMADDLDEVRAALGYAQINLLGVSYGSRLALEYMRRYPERTRSAALDGVVPPDASVTLASPAHAEAALGLVLGDCEADPACAAAFPRLERKLAQVLADLDGNRVLEELEHPRTGERVRVDITRPGFAAVLQAALYSGHTSSLLPLMIDRAHAGDYGSVAAVALSSAPMAASLSSGLYFTVSCGEDLRTLGPDSRREAVADLTVFNDHTLAQLEQVCARWPHAQVEPELFMAVESSVPTLLLSGRYDPVTPPALAEQVAGSLSDARHLIVESVSHGVWPHGCAAKLLAEFFARPEPANLDASCLDALARPRVFVTANGSRRLADAPETHR